MDSLYRLLIKALQEAGFPLAGALDLDLGLPLFSSYLERYDQWLKNGNAGQMQWLHRGRERRADPRLVFQEAESILCVAIPYSPRSSNPTEAVGPRYARYLQAGDYHTALAERLESAMCALEIPNLKWKICVDTSAVLERSWAALTGLGWIGKNTLLINPKYGSYLFLAEVLLNQKVGRGPTPLPDYCGNCSRCLTSCPTNALPEPHVLNANRCISYLTLEKRGVHDASPELLREMGSWVAGCDRCQEACPFNIKSERAAVDPTELGALSVQSWEDLIQESPEQYKERVKYSSLRRVKPGDFSRNLAIALFNAFHDSSTQEKILLRNRLSSAVDRRVALELDLIARTEWVRVSVTLMTDNSTN